jgi:hypothetical protein
MRYPKQESGEWVEPQQEGFKFMCCDCSLVHTLNFRIVKGKVEFQAFRDNRATAQARRQRPEKVKK